MSCASVDAFTELLFVPVPSSHRVFSAESSPVCIPATYFTQTAPNFQDQLGVYRRVKLRWELLIISDSRTPLSPRDLKTSTRNTAYDETYGREYLSLKIPKHEWQASIYYKQAYKLRAPSGESVGVCTRHWDAENRKT